MNSNQSKEVKLLPCAFCGEEGIIDFKQMEGHYYYWVTCDTDECNGNVDSVWGSDLHAIDAWNRRAPVPPNDRPSKELQTCTCGVPFEKHLGLIGTCEELQKLKKDRKEMEDAMIESASQCQGMQYEVHRLNGMLDLSKQENHKLRIDLRYHIETEDMYNEAKEKCDWLMEENKRLNTALKAASAEMAEDKMEIDRLNGMLEKAREALEWYSNSKLYVGALHTDLGQKAREALSQLSQPKEEVGKIQQIRTHNRERNIQYLRYLFRALIVIGLLMEFYGCHIK